MVGSEGQDGRILFELLAGEGLNVVGLGRNSARSTDGTYSTPVDLGSPAEIAALLSKTRPDEIYYLAAVHRASQEQDQIGDAALIDASVAVHVTGIVNILEQVEAALPASSVFYAASSLVFGDAAEMPQTESTPFRPCCVYGITKTAGVHACQFYRRSRGVRVSTGLFYNHESPQRRHGFVSRKIVSAAAAIAEGRTTEKLVIGNLSALVDWGYAPDVIDAVIRITRQPVPDDYIVATGEAHTVQEFTEIAFAHVGLSWRDWVEERSELLTRPHVSRIGDASLLRDRTGWRPTVNFREMVEILVDGELESNAA